MRGRSSISTASPVIVTLAQTVGFASRRTHGMAVNRIAGYLIAGLAVPATAALVGYAGAGSQWWVGPAVFDALVAIMLEDELRPASLRLLADGRIGL